MTNKVQLEIEKDVRSCQTMEFSTKFNHEQFYGWIESKEQDSYFWEKECSDEWMGYDSPDIRIDSSEVKVGQGNDHCPYDDEIQEWLNENK
jgi:hypothetical protein